MPQEVSGEQRRNGCACQSPCSPSAGLEEVSWQHEHTMCCSFLLVTYVTPLLSLIYILSNSKYEWPWISSTWSLDFQAWIKEAVKTGLSDPFFPQVWVAWFISASEVTGFVQCNIMVFTQGFISSSSLLPGVSQHKKLPLPSLPEISVSQVLHPSSISLMIHSPTFVVIYSLWVPNQSPSFLPTSPLQNSLTMPKTVKSCGKRKGRYGETVARTTEEVGGPSEEKVDSEALHKGELFPYLWSWSSPCLSNPCWSQTHPPLGIPSTLRPKSLSLWQILHSATIWLSQEHLWPEDSWWVESSEALAMLSVPRCPQAIFPGVHPGWAPLSTWASSVPWEKTSFPFLIS